MQTLPHFETHPIADIWPLMSEEEIASLAKDITENGLISPIYLYEEKILDGRNRALACKLANVMPRFMKYTGDNPVGFAFSLNEKRRHLSSGARAALAVEAKPFYEEEARKRRKETEGRPVVNTIKLQEKVTEVSKPNLQSRDQAAKDFRTNGKYVTQAEKVKKAAPEVFEKLKNGKVSMQDALKEVRKIPVDPWMEDEKERRELVEKGQTVIANAERCKNLIQWAAKKDLVVEVGRGTPFGNPFILGKDGTREEVCENYSTHYLPFKPSISALLPTLRGKVLVCHCYPEQCHADALKDALDNACKCIEH